MATLLLKFSYTCPVNGTTYTFDLDDDNGIYTVSWGNGDFLYIRPPPSPKLLKKLKYNASSLLLSLDIAILVTQPKFQDLKTATAKKHNQDKKSALMALFGLQVLPTVDEFGDFVLNNDGTSLLKLQSATDKGIPIAKFKKIMQAVCDLTLLQFLALPNPTTKFNSGVYIIREVFLYHLSSANKKKMLQFVYGLTVTYDESAGEDVPKLQAWYNNCKAKVDASNKTAATKIVVATTLKKLIKNDMEKQVQKDNSEPDYEGDGTDGANGTDGVVEVAHEEAEDTTFTGNNDTGSLTTESPALVRNDTMEEDDISPHPHGDVVPTETTMEGRTATMEDGDVTAHPQANIVPTKTATEGRTAVRNNTMEEGDLTKTATKGRTAQEISFCYIHQQQREMEKRVQKADNESEETTVTEQEEPEGATTNTGDTDSLTTIPNDIEFEELDYDNGILAMEEDNISIIPTKTDGADDCNSNGITTEEENISVPATKLFPLSIPATKWFPRMPASLHASLPFDPYTTGLLPLGGMVPDPFWETDSQLKGEQQPQSDDGDDGFVHATIETGEDGFIDLEVGL